LRARAAVKEMHRQMGDSLVFDDDGLLRRGLLIRLLVLPNDIGEIEASLRWIRDELGPRTAVSLMAQYYPTNKAATDPRYILLSRRISEGEWFHAVSLLEDLGMEEGFMQEYESASYYYRPDFGDSERPFKDIRDFT
jgi:putative pyruvate formate lyase activating enzyme